MNILRKTIAGLSGFMTRTTADHTSYDEVTETRIARGVSAEYANTIVTARSGDHEHDLYFGLSYAHFAIIPRVLSKNMSDAWKLRFADLMAELDSEFPNFDQELIVRGKGEGGRMAKLPTCVTKYRYPDKRMLAAWRGWPVPDLEFGHFLNIIAEVAEVSPHIAAEYLNDATDGAPYGHPDYEWDREAAQNLGREMAQVNE